LSSNVHSNKKYEAARDRDTYNFVKVLHYTLSMSFLMNLVYKNVVRVIRKLQYRMH